MNAAALLERLDDVRETGPDKYIAKCPAHQDRSPSLAIRHTDDRWLIHCFGGCAASDVVHAVGLELADLFDRPRELYKPGNKRPRVDYKMLCILSQRWAVILNIFLQDIAAGKQPNPTDLAICRHALAKFHQFAGMDL